MIEAAEISRHGEDLGFSIAQDRIYELIGTESGKGFLRDSLGAWAREKTLERFDTRMDRRNFIPIDHHVQDRRLAQGKSLGDRRLYLARIPDGHSHGPKSLRHPRNIHAVELGAYRPPLILQLLAMMDRVEPGV